jgi:hypothetical protein
MGVPFDHLTAINLKDPKWSHDKEENEQMLREEDAGQTKLQC